VELIGWLFLAVLGIFGAAASRQLTDEFKAWTPWLIDRLVRRAVRQLPENQRERFSEEWHSHVTEVPGDVGKLIVAFGFLSASWKMGGSDNHPKLRKQIVEEEPKALPPVGSMRQLHNSVQSRQATGSCCDPKFRFFVALNSLWEPARIPTLALFESRAEWFV
jgi:hypothetical protein